ncbi:MAG: flavin reductase [Spirochaetales bacterium]|nr:flavin reductase [Spirochaetales bacterium]
MAQKLAPYDRYKETIEPFCKQGIILVSGTQGNPMTIGWGSIGVYWGKPVFTVVVRPSRYSYELLIELPEFSVNVMGDDYKKQVAYCGSCSGRDENKAQVCGFELASCDDIKVPYIRQALFHYECRILNHADFMEEAMNKEIATRFYPQKDYHRAFYGEILGLYEAREKHD